MRNYSRQNDKFIDSTNYASSYCRECDHRTYVQYYKDINGFIHSDTFNYSILGSKTVTIEQFNQCILNDVNIKVSIL